MTRDVAVIFNTAFGWAGAAMSGEGIQIIALPSREKKNVERELRAAGFTLATTQSAIIRKTVKLLQKFFDAKLVSFDLPLDLSYHTIFQQAVWKAAAAIPYGETRSYQWIAKKIGKPKAARAVGQALGANPVPVLIP